MQSENDIYDGKTFWRTLAGIALAVAVQKASGGAGFVLLVPFALAALVQRNAEKMIYWVLLVNTLVMGNGYFMPKGAVFFCANRLVLGCFGLLGILHLFGRKKSSALAPLLWFPVYVLYMIVPSATGWQPLISGLKIFLFTIVFFAFFGVANTAATNPKCDARRLRAMVLAFASFMIFGSVALIPFPGISQLSGEEYARAVQLGQDVTSLFKGMTWHSQSLGPIVCALFVLTFGDWAFNVRRFHKLYAALLVCCPILIYKTSSRAGMASFIIGALFVGYCLLQMRGAGAKWRGKILSGMALALCACCVAAVAVPSVRDGVVRFAMKYDREAKAGDFNAEGMLATRQFLIDAQLENVKRSPFIGNGFQVADYMEGVQVQSWQQLVTAPVEKGVWLTAVLEEGGWIGLVLFSSLVVVIGATLLKRKVYTGLCLFGVLIVSNMAEFTMFSMSATGGFVCALIFVGGVFDALRQRADRLAGVPWGALRGPARFPVPPMNEQAQVGKWKNGGRTLD